MRKRILKFTIFHKVFLILSAVMLLWGIYAAGFSPQAFAQDEDKAKKAAAEIALEKCKTPRLAVASVFSSSEDEQVQCLDDANSYTLRLEQADRIRVVFSGRQAITPNDFTEKEDGGGKGQITVHEKFPKIAIRREPDGRWIWPAKSLAEVDKAYQDINTLPFVSRLPSWARASLGSLRVWQIVALLLVIVVGLVVRKIIEIIVAGRVKQLIEKTGQEWASKLVGVFGAPGGTLVMALLLRVTYPPLGLPIGFAAFLGLAVRILMISSVVWAVYRLVDVLGERMAAQAEKTETKLDDQLVPLIRKSLKVFTVVAGGLVILQNLNVNVGALIATLGVGGVAIALAAKDTVANFFGSLMIFIDRPFQIGDWIKIGAAEGTVEEVGFRSTRIRTFYNSVITVPNAKFTEAQIDNMGLREYRRCFVTLGVTYDTTPEQMQAFCEGIRAVIAANPHTRKDYYEVHMSGFGSHSLDVMVYFFFKVDTWTDELTERHNVFLEFMRLAQDLKIGFAFPTQTLHVDYVHPPGQERAVPEAEAEPELASVVHAFGPDGKRARPGGPTITEQKYVPQVAGARGNEDADG